MGTDTKMKFALALLATTVSAAGTVATGGKCTKATECKSDKDCCMNTVVTIGGTAAPATNTCALKTAATPTAGTTVGNVKTVSTCKAAASSGNMAMVSAAAALAVLSQM